MVSVRGGGIDSLYQQRPAHFLDVPGFRHPGDQLVFGGFGMAFGTLLFLGFWNKKSGILGALGSSVTFIMTATIIPFMPNGWAASAGGFPAMTERVAFLMKDIVIFAASFHLLKQDVARVAFSMGVPTEYRKAA